MFKTKNRWPIIISLVLFVIGISSTILLIYLWTKSLITISDIVSNSIQIWICVGAFISVAYVISSYRQTNTAFILSQKPHLLIQVINAESNIHQDKSEPCHVTTINYKNNSGNAFYDLSIFIKVSTLNTNVDLSDLFTHNMYMASQDSRNRRFVTVDELRKRGFEIQTAAEQNQEITLSLTYEFKFNNKTEKVRVQDYYWDTSETKHRWIIK